MSLALWIVQGVLAAAFLMAGIGKLSKPKDELRETMAWVEDFSEGSIKTIAALEILAAIGLVLPGITGAVPVLVPLASLGLAIEQMGALIVHARRSETREITMNIVFIALSLFVAWGRFGEYQI